MLHYILQTIAFQLFFLIIYDAFLKKETFFNWNRAYLLVTAMLSMVLPFIKIQSFKNVVPKEFVVAMPEVIIVDAQGINTNQTVEIIATEASKFQWSWEALFYIGAFVALIIFLVKLFKIASLIYKNPKYWSNNLRIVTLLKSNVAFSFFYYVFLGEQIKEEDKPAILKHESVHVNQNHTLDLLLFELFRIVFWFNPLIYMYQNRIAALHEFIADAEAVKSQGKNEYYQDLLSQIFETENVSFINAFYKKSLIKKRIVMLTKAKSKQVQLIKYALLIPLVFGMLLYTSSYAQDSTSKAEEITQEMTDEELQEKYYKEILEIKDKNGSYFEINDLYNYRSKKYVPTRDEYIRYLAYNQYLGENAVKHAESKEPIDFEQLNRLKSMFFKDKRSYEEHLEYLKTEESKKSWENARYNRTLQVIAEDLNHLTIAEKNEIKEKTKDILYGNLYKRLKITDGKTTTLITESDYDGLINYLSIQEINELLNRIKTGKSKITSSVKKTQIQDQIEVPFAVIDEAPVFPGCESITDLKERKKCMSSKISELVQKNFNTDLAGKSGLSGRQRISVAFKIDTLGNVIEIRSRAAHPDLETEAERVIGLLPKMQPGKQKGHKVVVPYSLPIIFEVAEGSNNSKEEINQEEREAYQKSLDELKNYNNGNSFPFALVDKIPMLPNCENIAAKSEQQKCVSDEIIRFTQKNFNTDLASKLNLKGQQRIMIVFIISENGTALVDKVRAPHPELEAEAKRTIGLLPKFTPGEHKGKKVNVSYSLPIVFMIK